MQIEISLKRVYKRRGEKKTWVTGWIIAAVKHHNIKSLVHCSEIILSRTINITNNNTQCYNIV